MATVIIPSFTTSKVVSGLNTYQHTLNTTAMHVAKITLTRPTNSNMTITINQNGSQVATTTLVPTLPDDGQTESTLSTTMNCTSGDIITFVLTSSNPNDQQLNTVKATLNIHVGSSN